MTARNGVRASRNGRTTPKKNLDPVVVSDPIDTIPVAPIGKLRLLKVFVQPMFVLDDGDSLREVQHPTIEVKGGDWREWSTTAYDDDALEALRSQVVPMPTTES